MIRIFDGDAAIAIKIGWSLNISAKTWNDEAGHYNPCTASGTLRVVTDFGEMNIAVTSTRTWTAFAEWTDSVAVAGYAFDAHWNDDPLYGQTGWFSIPRLLAWRRTNKVVEIALSTTDALPISAALAHSICLVLPDRFETKGYLIEQDNPARYFSYHPVTHELLESSSPICHV